MSREGGEDETRRRTSGFDARWEAIYDRHAKSIYYLALRMLGDPTQAEDAAQDVFVKCFRKLDQFRGDADVKTWLYRITVNHCRNLSQSWYQRKMRNNVDDLVWEQTSGSETSPFQALATKELGRRIQASLDALPPEYRLLLLLIADEKLSYDEVAQLTQQSVDAVRGKLHRARKAFARQFQQTH